VLTFALARLSCFVQALENLRKSVLFVILFDAID